MAVYNRSLISAASGGITAWITGGEFLNGALRGLTIELLNHIKHSRMNISNFKIREDGSHEGDLPGITVRAVKFDYVTLFDIQIGEIAVLSTALSVIGQSIVQSESTFAILHQYNKSYQLQPNISPIKQKNLYKIDLSKQAARVVKGVVRSSKIICGIQIFSGALKDLENFKFTGRTDFYHVAKATGQALMGNFIGNISFELGVAIGTLWGGPAGGIAGGVSLGALGATMGFEAGGILVDRLYGK